MNWIKIESSNPKAFELFSESLETKSFIKKDIFYFHSVNGIETFNKRDLYDFFDEQGVYIEVAFCIAEGEKINEIDSFVCDIYNDKGEDQRVTGDILTRTRKQAETAAFTKAFELLELKLNKV